MASNSNVEAPPAPAGAPSLAQWRSGAAKMTTAEAGKQVAQTAPPKPRPKAPSSSKPVLSTRPWHEQSVEERYGNRAPKVPVNINKQIRDTLRYLEAFQDRECSWEEIATNGIPPWWVGGWVGGCAGGGAAAIHYQPCAHCALRHCGS
jgi:hypothetical protein